MILLPNKLSKAITRLRRKNIVAASEIEQIITQNSLANKGQMNIMQNSLQNLANEGRQILKIIDDFKFKLIQSSNIFKDDKIKIKLEQKQKILASAASLIYSIVFDMENMDLTPVYEEEQFSTLNTDESNDDEVNNEFDTNEFEGNDIDEGKKESDEEDNENEEDNDEDGELKLQGGFDESDESEEDNEGSEDLSELMDEDFDEEEGGKK